MRYEVGLELEFRWLLNQQRYGRTARITRVEGLLYDLKTDSGATLRWAAYEITRAMKPVVVGPIRVFNRCPGIGRRVKRVKSPVIGIVIRQNALDAVTVQWTDGTKTVEDIKNLTRG